MYEYNWYFRLMYNHRKIASNTLNSNEIIMLSFLNYDKFDAIQFFKMMLVSCVIKSVFTLSSFNVLLFASFMKKLSKHIGIKGKSWVYSMRPWTFFHVVISLLTYFDINVIFTWWIQWNSYTGIPIYYISYKMD